MKSPGWILGVALLAATPMASPLPTASQVVIAPGSSAQGARLLQEKTCLNCHAFNGRGGTGAPDLAQRSQHSYTPTRLASVLWNHSPSMWSALDAKNLTLPLMSSTETADLFAYFYSSLYFDAPGDAARGKATFENKNCAGCHRTGQPHKVLMAGPPIADWIEVKDPLMWAERMWNHSYEMYHATWDVGVKYPQLTTQNVADIMAYLSGLRRRAHRTLRFSRGVRIGVVSSLNGTVKSATPLGRLDLHNLGKSICFQDPLRGPWRDISPRCGITHRPCAEPQEISPRSSLELR